MAAGQDLRHVVSDAPRVMVVDGSRMVRKLIGDTLQRDVPNAEVIGCAGSYSDMMCVTPSGRKLSSTEWSCPMVAGVSA